MPDITFHVKEKLLSPAELAELLGIKPDSVADAEIAGRLPPARRTPGHHRRWVPSEVVAHLRARGATVPPELALLAGESPPNGAGT